MNVYVAAVDTEDCPAHLALAAEGLPHETEVLGYDPFAYGKWLGWLWSQGRGFVLVEHDIAPWPGAVRQLIGCGRPWCAFPYPWCIGLGLVKFSTELILQQPYIAGNWSLTNWQSLDMQVIEEIQAVTGFDVHVHEPAVAHVRKTPPKAAHTFQGILRAADT